MKILYLAFACNPYTGSEAQCGWSWALSMCNLAQVSVVTRRENRANIQRYLKENNIKNLNVYYCDIPDIINIYYKTRRGYHLYYLMWQKIAYQFVKKLHQSEKFDIIHHITLGDFRYLGSYWKLGVKTIFGPVGGAQLTPKVFEPYIRGVKSKEKIREIINYIVTINPFYRKSLNKASLVLAANCETQIFLQNFMKKPEKCELLSENGVQSCMITEYKKRDKKEITTLLWSGRMVNRKGLSLLLDVLHMLSKEKKYELILVGDGPEKKTLEMKVEKLGLSDKVVFTGKIDYEQMSRYYQYADVFIFPSLRETTGTVLFEAMANGLPVISFDQNGAQLLIDKTCGIKVRLTDTLSDILEEFSRSIEYLIDHPEERNLMGRSAYEKIVNEYLWERKCELFFERYSQIGRNEN